MKEKIKKIISRLLNWPGTVLNIMLDKLNNLSVPAVILIASLILGSFYYASQVNKQKSIERQQEIKIEKEQQAKEEAERQIQLNARLLDACLSDARTTYVNFWDSECEGLGKAKDCRLPMYLVERLDVSEEKDKAECFKRYPQK